MGRLCVCRCVCVVRYTPAYLFFSLRTSACLYDFMEESGNIASIFVLYMFACVFVCLALNLSFSLSVYPSVCMCV